VGAIAPWNFPITQAVWKVAPAIAGGNAVVLTPLEHTTLESVWWTSREASLTWDAECPS
jgi:acyl-CoA reductase-like NAD-dependent aldehyde dehydrogenase